MIDLTVARRYAKALLTLGRDDGNYKDYGEALSGFAHLLAREPELQDAMLNPIYSREDRRKLVDKMVEILQMPTMVSNLLQLLFDKNRLNAVAGVAQSYQQMVDQVENITRATVTAAIPLDEETTTRLKQALAELTKSTVVMQVQEDPDILGGIVARVGDLVLDGSVRTQVLSLRESLIKGEVL